MGKVFACLLALSFSPLIGASQNTARLDSLAAVAERLPDDTTKIRRLFDLANDFETQDLEKALGCLQRAYALAQHLGAKDWLPELETDIGRGYANSSRPDSALHYFALARTAFERSGDQKGLARVLTNIRWVHNYLGNYEKALSYALQALALYEKSGDEADIANAYSYIGDILYSQKKWPEAINYAQKAYDIQQKLHLQEDMAYTAQALGDAWLQMRDYDKALSFQNEGLSIRKALQADSDVAHSLLSRGNVFKYTKRYPEALADYQAALKIAEQTGFVPAVKSCANNIGHVYNLMGEYKKALPYHLRVYRIGEETGDINQSPENLDLLAEAYAGIGRHDSAYFFQKRCTQVSDSLLSEETSSRMSELQTQYETAQKEAKIAVQEEQISRERLRFWALLGGLLAALLAGGLLFRLTRRLRQRNAEKEFLIKEIHHRVKNNLQVLSSLLHLQSRQITDEAALDAVREGQNRVDAMGLIHQKLYMGDNLAAVEMQDYLHKLGDTLLDSFGMNDDRVKINYSVAPMHLDVDTAIPLGLIINELATNSLKYAFADGRPGSMDISLWKDEAGKLCLKVADDGAGQNAAPDPKHSTGFGASLVQMLSKKLGGQPEVTAGEGGYATLIRFEHFKISRM